MTLVCAPPGAGKSTLLASALAPSPTRRPPVAWLCLDERDNDAGRLVALLRSALSDDGAAPVRARSAVPVLDQLDDLLGRLADGGGAGAGARVLVLDDAHALRSPTALGVVAHLVHNAPAQLDIVLCSRADLPVGLEDLRLDGRLGEIRNADLAFSRSETAELLDLHEVTLAPDDAYALWARTEGWAAGLRLASCALQTDPDPGRFVRSATRTASVMSDYLLRELLVRKDDDVQWFLLRTSVADRLTPELAVLLSDDPRAAEHLVELERSGILVVDHEDDRWHRYHALFGALLRARLNRHDTDLARELHGRAAQWFLGREMPSEAELHAQSACDWDLLGQLVAWRWIDATLEGHAIDGDLLPPGLEPTTVAEAPGLALIAAADACRRANHDEADLYRGALDDLVAQPEHAPVGEPEPFANERLVLDVVFGCAFGSDARSQAAAATLRTMAVVDPSAVNLRRFGMLRGAELALDSGDVERARAMLADLADRADCCWVTTEATALLALLHAAVGRPALVGPLVDQVLDGAGGCTTALAACAARLATVLALAQRGEHRSATDTLAGAAPAGGPVASRSLRTVHRVAGVGLSSVPGRPVTLDAPSVGGPLAELALLALGVVEIVTPDGRPVPLGGPGEQAVKEARLRLISGEPERADLAVGPWLARVDGRTAHPRTLVEALAVAGIAAGARGDQVSTRRCLAEALDLTDATGALAPLLHHGGLLAPLLQRNLSELGDRMGAALLLLDRTRPTGAGELVEPLTGREMEVLIHLPTLMSNAEIASGLYLSVNTVKTHLKAVYRKLGVDGRRQAVARGRELELI